MLRHSIGFLLFLKNFGTLITEGGAEEFGVRVTSEESRREGEAISVHVIPKEPMSRRRGATEESPED